MVPITHTSDRAMRFKYGFEAEEYTQHRRPRRQLAGQGKIRLELAQLPQCRAGNRLKIKVPSIFQSLFGWFFSQVFTGRMISVGTPSASYRTLWSGSGVALRRIRRTPFWSVGRTIVAIS